MANRTGIEWTERTWNPLRGCSRVSDGCRNCYAETVAHRFNGPGQPYEGLTHPTGAWNGTIKLIPEKLAEPWHLVEGQRIFVNSMSDLFHPAVPFEFIAAVFWVMSVTRRHTYQVLTKRPERMLAFFTWLLKRHDPIDSALFDMHEEHAGNLMQHALREAAHQLPEVQALDWVPATKRRGGYDCCGPDWPFDNVWLGVSVEDQATANTRIPILLKVPAAVRWISAEPLLGRVDLTEIPGAPGSGHGHHEFSPIITMNVLQRPVQYPPLPQVNWVVVGGESGRGARPMHPDWARSLRDQCAAARVPFLFKQWGEWGQYVNEDHFCYGGEERHPHAWVDGKTGVHGLCWVEDDDGLWVNHSGNPPMRADGQVLDRVAVMGRHGKKAAGRLLDGALHDAYPEVRG